MTTTPPTGIFIGTIDGMGCIDDCLRSFEGEPNLGPRHFERLWLARGLLAPVLDAAVNLHRVLVRGRWLAAWRVATCLVTAVRHVRFSVQPGCHFLPLTTGAARPFSPDGTPDQTMAVK